MANARDAIRETHITHIQRAVYIYCVEDQSTVPSTNCYQDILKIPSTERGLKEICNSSDFTAEECQEAGFVNLSLLTPKYFYLLPKDPLNSKKDIGTGYFIGHSPVTVLAKKAEMRASIVVGFLEVNSKVERERKNFTAIFLSGEKY